MPGSHMGWSGHLLHPPRHSNTRPLKSFKRLYADDAFVFFTWLLAVLTAVDQQLVAKYMFQLTAFTSGQLYAPPSSNVEDNEKHYRRSIVVVVFFYSSL